MTRRRTLHLAQWLLPVAAFCAVAAADDRPAQPAAKAGGRFGIDWHSIDSGSPTPSPSARYAIRGAIGQADVGTLSGGPYRIDAGYWAGSGVLAVDGRIFSNGFEADAATAVADSDRQAAWRR